MNFKENKKTLQSYKQKAVDNNHSNNVKAVLYIAKIYAIVLKGKICSLLQNVLLFC